jgi:hypothetical protein
VTPPVGDDLRLRSVSRSTVANATAGASVELVHIEPYVSVPTKVPASVAINGFVGASNHPVTTGWAKPP